ncbi:MAG: hypothetical protein A3H96_10315 [Acidobacteria bacterium RIFCSPLOWO2_02_FULL_67_36]|nr:MAG: hypothetical protein A3H96_10315 [Acidobacteria bacterium RIFCSPLOWO2_02_FULL_67_36]OFW24426.1 MAG: hypothetical protein A3G21_17855 [Acidobacteria bacterium RIFCSPLOWO2_12_FULL_66_21]
MKFHGGDEVRFGFYWNVREWEAQIVPREGGELKGRADVTYVRLPLLALLVLAPIMGGVYAIFLPFIGIAMVLMYLAGRLRSFFKTTPPAVDATASAAEAHGKSGTAPGDSKRAA